MTMTIEEKKSILYTMSKLTGVAEYPSEQTELKDFLNIPAYQNLRDENRFLILGGRGSGKTQLYRTLSTREGYALIMGENTGPAIRGYDSHSDEGIEFPTNILLESLKTERQNRLYWMGSLLFVLLHRLSDSAIQETAVQMLGKDLFDRFSNIQNLKKPSQWVFALEAPAAQEDVEAFLSAVDDTLARSGQKILVIYDDLDLIAEAYDDLFPWIRNLIRYWFMNAKRWRRIKCKIMLRKDLFEAPEMVFPDSSKLYNHRYELQWKPFLLYQLFLKRMANAGNPEIVRYLERDEGLIHLNRQRQDEFEPTTLEETMKRFVIRLIGRYMGNSPRKGESYYWIPNHLQDANGVLAPRSFLSCFSASANWMLNNADSLNQLAEEQLLKPAAIQSSVMEVSKNRVAELREEYPWLGELQKAFDGLTMLMDKDEFIDCIDLDLWKGKQWNKLPEKTQYGLFTVLEKLGIVFVTPDDRVNVPEIYLHGFNMKRKGGLKRV